MLCYWVSDSLLGGSKCRYHGISVLKYHLSGVAKAIDKTIKWNQRSCGWKKSFVPISSCNPSLFRLFIWTITLNPASSSPLPAAARKPKRFLLVRDLFPLQTLAEQGCEVAESLVLSKRINETPTFYLKRVRKSNRMQMRAEHSWWMIQHTLGMKMSRRSHPLIPTFYPACNTPYAPLLAYCSK